MSAHVDNGDHQLCQQITEITTKAAAAATNNDPEKKQQLPLLVERPYRRRIKPPPPKIHHVRPASFRRFVQKHTDAYVAWCSSNGFVLSPGTMADLMSHTLSN
ncbi:hypothetical protein E2562_031991 [Oryza meyeriana var. granulata]|uniref:VQ domain-containing protein n=1 Tax=Oryza meyeriana var. granulata TaxID=110450 RepID=A0A6G1F0G3_9ORYZ|nr:hypothetical protein E2562_031991 [Oryza meyeriana var. granulata]